jgi:hypothetical protein
MPHSPGKNAPSYATVRDEILHYIKMTYKGGQMVADSLEQGQKLVLTKPTFKVSTASNEAVRAMETEANKIEYDQDMRIFKDQMKELDDGMVAAYSLIYSKYCSKSMQSKIESHPDLETKIKNNPIELLEAIKSLMHDPVRAQYPLQSADEVLLRFVNNKQHEGEDLESYTKRFKQYRDVLTTQMGKSMWNEFVENLPEYRNETDDDARKALKEQGFEAWLAL